MLSSIKKIIVSGILTSFVWIVSAQMAFSQCAMCKATVENSENSETFAAGLNAGILYLMSVPYILFTVIAILWYRNSKRNKEKREKIEKKLKQTISRA